MPPAKSTDIDLLPKDLAAKKRPAAAMSLARGSLVEYTDASGSKKTDKPAPKKRSFFSGFFSLFFRAKREAPKLAFKSSQARLPNGEPAQAPPPKPRPHDLPQGKPLASALFAGAKQHAAKGISEPIVQPVREPFSSGVAAGDVSAMHAPSVSSGQIARPQSAPAKPMAALPSKTLQGSRKEHAPLSAAPQKFGVPKKESWWKGWFLRKKAAPLPAPELRPEPQPITASAVKPPNKPPAAIGAETEAPVHRLSHFDVNLLSAEYVQTFEKSNPFAFLAAGVGLTALAVVLAYAMLHLYQGRAQAALGREERVVAALSEAIAAYEDVSDQDSALRAKAEASRELVGNHVSWSAFLGELEAVTIPEVTYITFAASTEGTMLVSAFARDYTSLARQIVVFQGTEWIRDITVTSASRVEESATSSAGVSFDVSLTIDTNVLYASR